MGFGAAATIPTLEAIITCRVARLHAEQEATGSQVRIEPCAERRHMYQLAKRHDYGINTCQQCLEKQREIDRLTEENQRLRAKLAQQKRKDQVGFCGSSTPSAQFPVKATSTEAKAATALWKKQISSITGLRIDEFLVRTTAPSASCARR